MDGRCQGGETSAQVCERADQAIACALDHMESRDVLFVGHGHFSRAVITRWIEQQVSEGIRFAMAAASIAVCGFEHGVRQLSALGLTGHPNRACGVTREPSSSSPAPGAVVAEGVHTAFPGSPTHGPPLRRTARQSSWAPYLSTFQTRSVDPTPVGACHRNLAGVAGRESCRSFGSRRRYPPPKSTERGRRGIVTDCETGSGLHKVVLARALRLAADGALDARTIVQRLVANDAAAYAYLVDLTAAGGGYSGAALVGASPELWSRASATGDLPAVRRIGPTAARSHADEASGAALAASAKNRHEHQLVVDAMRDALEPLCTDLQIAEPELSQDRGGMALYTLITAGYEKSQPPHSIWRSPCIRHRRSAGSRPAATALINELEGDRGFYAGAVGWCDQRGDGRWVVSIRCAQLSADRRTADAHSGGGIVAESDPTTKSRKPQRNSTRSWRRWEHHD